MVTISYMYDWKLTQQLPVVVRIAHSAIKKTPNKLTFCVVVNVLADIEWTNRRVCEPALITGSEGPHAVSSQARSGNKKNLFKERLN